MGEKGKGVNVSLLHQIILGEAVAVLVFLSFNLIIHLVVGYVFLTS